MVTIDSGGPQAVPTKLAIHVTKSILTSIQKGRPGWTTPPEFLLTSRRLMRISP